MAKRLGLEDRLMGALMGAAVGDALGVPYEFTHRVQRKNDPASKMEGWMEHNQPPGTWSDDTSMTLGVAQALIDHAGQPLDDAFLKQMVVYFVAWMRKAAFTAGHHMFDIGNTTAAVLRQYPEQYAANQPLVFYGEDHEGAQGNGSLMRLIPLALWNAFHPLSQDLIDKSSEITHGHPNVLAICNHYINFVDGLVQWSQSHAGEDFPIVDLLKAATAKGEAYHREANYHFDIDTLLARSYDSFEGKADGYVLYSIELVYWCLAHSKSFKEATLLAVNMGEDTDTHASIVGSLAGFIYGLSGIPEDWLKVLRNKELLDNTYSTFLECLLSSKLASKEV